MGKTAVHGVTGTGHVAVGLAHNLATAVTKAAHRQLTVVDKAASGTLNNLRYGVSGVVGPAADLVNSTGKTAVRAVGTVAKKVGLKKGGCAGTCGGKKAKKAKK
jgi:hypothetical protein